MTGAQAQMAKAKAKSKRERYEDEFAYQCRAYKLPEALRNYRFAQVMERQWRFDFAFPLQMVAVEIEGLVVKRIGDQLVTMGRHANVAGFREDCLKYAAAVHLGWRLLRFEQSQVTSGEAIEWTIRVLGSSRLA